MNNKLIFSTPADHWMKAVPLGNAKLGAMVLGGVAKETIFLNEETFWAGTSNDSNNPTAHQYLEEVRALIFSDKRQQAKELIEGNMLSRFNQPYQPLGRLELDFTSAEEAPTDYCRVLDMEKGILEVSYKIGGNSFKRESFCSSPHKVFALKLSCDSPCLSFRLTASGNAKSTAVFSQAGSVSFTAVAPSKVDIYDVYTFPQDSEVLFESDQSIKGSFFVKIITDGQLSCDDGSVSVSDAKEAVILLAAATDFNESSPATACKERVNAGVDIGYQLLKEMHIADFSPLYNKISLSLNGDRSGYSSIEALLANRLSGGNKETLTEILFNFGRYLLISSSRGDSLPATLQGIWNHKEIPPWWSNWTMNINLEMNYWLASKCGLSQCLSPLYKFIKDLSVKGRETAKVHYNCSGWTAHHMTDIWLNTAPIGFEGKRHKNSASWAMWNMTAPWLCLFLWEEYLYSGDKIFLEEFAYPIMKGALDFLLDWQRLMDGRYETLPSTSPEAIYLDGEGRENSVCMSSAMDTQIITQFYQVMLEAISVLGIEGALGSTISHRLSLMPQVVVGANGGIMEWDKDYTQEDLGHRHFSNLFGVYPGSTITGASPDLMEAAKKSLEIRLKNGSASTSWSCVWAICLAARMEDSSLAYELIGKFLSEDIFDNLFSYHPPNYFQIDGNLGFTNAVLELLVREVGGVTTLMPALPKKWHSGKLAGLVLKGGDVLDLKWKDSVVTAVRIVAKSEGELSLVLNRDFEVTSTDGLIVKSTDMRCNVKKKAGAIYLIA